MVKAVLSSLKRAEPRVNTGVDYTRGRLEDRFSSRAMLWESAALTFSNAATHRKKSEGLHSGYIFR
jgi:hypothetical protein